MREGPSRVDGTSQQEGGTSASPSSQADRWRRVRVVAATPSYAAVPHTVQPGRDAVVDRRRQQLHDPDRRRLQRPLRGQLRLHGRDARRSRPRPRGPPRWARGPADTGDLDLDRHDYYDDEHADRRLHPADSAPARVAPVLDVADLLPVLPVGPGLPVRRTPPPTGTRCARSRCSLYGIDLYPAGPLSAYRSYAQQLYLYDLYLSGQGSLAAPPGTSSHEYGTAIDLADPVDGNRHRPDRRAVRMGEDRGPAASGGTSTTSGP